MILRLKDCIDSIMMYASEPIRPSNIRVFDIKPEMWEWLKEHSEAARVLLYGWKDKILGKMPTALVADNGDPHEVPQGNPLDDGGGVP